MNMTKITEKNFFPIAGKIIKFFNHKDVVTWHNYNGKGKRRIQPDFISHVTGERLRPINRFGNVKIYLVTPESEPIFKKYFLRIHLDEENGFCINIGDEVSFKGNKIVIKQKDIHFGGYIYEVYQLWDPNGGFKDIPITNLFGWPMDDLIDDLL